MTELDQDDQPGSREQPSAKAAADEIYAAIRSSSIGPAASRPVRVIRALDPDTERKHINNEDRRNDITLKKLYAKWFIAILIGQLLLMNAVFIGVGIKCLAFEEYALHLYMGGTLAEVFGIVLVITKYLFPKRAD